MSHEKTNPVSLLSPSSCKSLPRLGSSSNQNCPGCFNRRAFLTLLGTAAGTAVMTPGTTWALAEPKPATKVKTRIRLVFSHHRDDAQGRQSEAGWPFLGYDCAGRKKALLAKLRKCCPEIEFLTATAYSAEDAKKL